MAADEVKNNRSRRKTPRHIFALELLELQHDLRMQEIEAEVEFYRKKYELLRQIENCRSRTSRQSAVRSIVSEQKPDSGTTVSLHEVLITSSNVFLDATVMNIQNSSEVSSPIVVPVVPVKQTVVLSENSYSIAVEPIANSFAKITTEKYSVKVFKTGTSREKAITLLSFKILSNMIYLLLSASDVDRLKFEEVRSLWLKRYVTAVVYIRLQTSTYYGARNMYQKLIHCATDNPVDHGEGDVAATTVWQQPIE